MEKLDLSNIAPLDILTGFTIESDYIDLHNSFDCIKIDTDTFSRIVVFHFESAASYYLLSFYKATTYQIKYDAFNPSIGKGLSFDLFSREIALQNRQGEWIQLPQNRRFFEVRFVEGLEIVIEAEKVLLLEGDFKRLQSKRILEEELYSLSIQLDDIRKELADTENHDKKEIKLFLQNRKQLRDNLITLEQEQFQKQKALADILQQEQQLIIMASGTE
jgi:hypothetical protein